MNKWSEWGLSNFGVLGILLQCTLWSSKPEILHLSLAPRDADVSDPQTTL